VLSSSILIQFLQYSVCIASCLMILSLTSMVLLYWYCVLYYHWLQHWILHILNAVSSWNLGSNTNAHIGWLLIADDYNEFMGLKELPIIPAWLLFAVVFIVVNKISSHCNIIGFPSCVSYDRVLTIVHCETTSKTGCSMCNAQVGRHWALFHFFSLLGKQFVLRKINLFVRV